MIYKVKRYSCYYQQREYGVFQDLKHSGLNRTYKKYIGRARKKVANKILEGIKKDIDASNLAGNNITYNPELHKINKKLRNNLVKEANKRNIRVLGTNLDPWEGRGNYFFSKESAERNNLVENLKYQRNVRTGKKAENALKKSDHVIFHPTNSHTVGLAHEMGHVENATGKNKFRRWINKKSQKIREKLLDGQNKKGILESIKKKIDNSILLQEERNATKKGLKLFKKSGANKEEMKDAKKFLKLGEESYKKASSADAKLPIYNWIQIPSKRYKF